MPFPAKTSTDAIIQSATDLIRSDGLASLSMRTLAARLGVRASSLYRHFPDRSTIEKTLAGHTSERLLASMQAAASGLAGEKALFASARAYLDFALAEPSFYDILMQAGNRAAQRPDATDPLWAYFLDSVSRATHFEQDEAGAAAFWSFLHGFAILCRTSRIGETAPRLTFARGAQALVRGLSVADADVARPHA